MKRILSKVVFIFCSVLLFATGYVHAVIISMTQYKLDLTDPNVLNKKAKLVFEFKNVSLTRDGLTLNASENASADIQIEVTEPIGVGLSWRPAQSVNIEAEINPPGEFIFKENSITYPSGSLYACYSADAMHWSNWQILKMDIPKDYNEPKQKYSGTLSVTQTQRQEYNKLLMQYQKMDVPWSSDEEAAIKWMVKNDPNFFDKPAPFIGYVRFLYEFDLKGGHTIKNIIFDINWAVSGLTSVPKDEKASKQRMNSMEPWRYKAPSSQKRQL